MENTQDNKQDSGLPSRPLIGSADAPDENAKRETPEEIASFIVLKAFIQSSYERIEKSLKENIAISIREAVKAEREACAEIAETDSILDWVGGSTGNAKGTAMRISRAIRSRTE